MTSKTVMQWLRNAAAIGIMGSALVLAGCGGGGSSSTPTSSAPVLSSINPNNGPTTGGTTVALAGSNLSGATAVTFGGAEATSFNVTSSTTITAVAPAHTAAGQVQVVVTTSAGSSNALTYTYDNGSSPVLDTITPNNGSTDGGNTVTITGSNLSGATTVTFDGTNATTFTVVSSTEVTAIPPAHSAGTVSVVLTTSAGSSNSVNYTYTALPAPDLESIDPTHGSPAGGEQITLSGNNFTGATSVLFGTTPGTSLHVSSSNAATVVTPAHAEGTVNVTITTPNGSSTLNNAFTYSTPGSAVLSLSTNTLSFVATNNATLTLQNTGSGTATNITNTSVPTGVNMQTTCGSTLAPSGSCIYSFYSASQQSFTFTVTGTDSESSSLSASTAITVTPMNGTVVESPSGDIVSGESTFLQTAPAASTLNTIFVDIGSLDFDFPVAFGNASGTCGTVTFFDYFAPAAAGGSCVNFSDLVTDYKKANSNLNVVVWISSTTEHIPNAEAGAVAGVIGNEISTTDNAATGVAIEGSALFSSPDSTDLGLFYTTLASDLKDQDKTLYIYEAPWADLTSETLSTLEADGNVVALIPLYDSLGTNGKADDPTEYNAAVNSIVNPNAKYGSLPVMYMPPASGTQENWQNLLVRGAGPDPYAGEPPSYIGVVSCSSVDSGISDSGCIGYQNNQTVHSSALPSGYSTPTYPQMFDYTRSALCAISSVGNTTTFNGTRYGGVIYYNIRPSSFYSDSTTPTNGTYPLGIPAETWQMLQDWSDASTRDNICACVAPSAADSTDC